MDIAFRVNLVHCQWVRTLFAFRVLLLATYNYVESMCHYFKTLCWYRRLSWSQSSCKAKLTSLGRRKRDCSTVLSNQSELLTVWGVLL